MSDRKTPTMVQFLSATGRNGVCPRRAVATSYLSTLRVAASATCAPYQTPRSSSRGNGLRKIAEDRVLELSALKRLRACVLLPLSITTDLLRKIDVK